MVVYGSLALIRSAALYRLEGRGTAAGVVGRSWEGYSARGGSERGPMSIAKRLTMLHGTLILTMITIVVLLLSAPASLEDDLRRHRVYLFSVAFFQDIPKRLIGPGRFRFILQPLMASIVGIRHGIADARNGRPAYLYGLLCGGARRRELIRNGLHAMLNVLLMGILVDSVCQWLVLGTSHFGASLVVGPVLVMAPYAVSRGLANRYARLRSGL